MGTLGNIWTQISIMKKELTPEVADEWLSLQETMNNFNKTEIQTSLKLKYFAELLEYAF